MLAEAVECEVQFADDLLEQGVSGMSLADMREYLQHVADRRLAAARHRAAVRQPEPVRLHGAAGRPGAVELLRTAGLGVPGRRDRDASASTTTSDPPRALRGHPRRARITRSGGIARHHYAARCGIGNLDFSGHRRDRDPPPGRFPPRARNLRHRIGRGINLHRGGRRFRRRVRIRRGDRQRTDRRFQSGPGRRGGRDRTGRRLAHRLVRAPAQPGGAERCPPTPPPPATIWSARSASWSRRSRPTATARSASASPGSRSSSTPARTSRSRSAPRSSSSRRPPRPACWSRQTPHLIEESHVIHLLIAIVGAVAAAAHPDLLRALPDQGGRAERGVHRHRPQGPHHPDRRRRPVHRQLRPEGRDGRVGLRAAGRAEAPVARPVQPADPRRHHAARSASRASAPTCTASRSSRSAAPRTRSGPPPSASCTSRTRSRSSPGRCWPARCARSSAGSPSRRSSGTGPRSPARWPRRPSTR